MERLPWLPLVVALLAVSQGSCRIGYDLLPVPDAGDGAVASDTGPVDASQDTSPDAPESGPSDADSDTGADAGTPPPDVVARFPWNGYATGTSHAVLPGVVNDPRRPKFAWDPVVEAIDYQLQVDDSCDLSSFRTCSFPSPELNVRTGSTTFRPAAALSIAESPPVGRRYYWRVRACSGACSNWTTPRYLRVGQMDTDFNGDGYADVLVSARSIARSELLEGGAFLYAGSASGVTATPSTSIDNPSDQAGGQLGFSLAASDINGDGYADAVIGAAGQDNPEMNEGVVFVFLGGPSGLATVPDATLDNPRDLSNGIMGAAVALKDVDGDGYADAVVGAPGQDLGGAAYYFRGGPGGLTTTPSRALSNPDDQNNAQFGLAVADVGDVNGDGYIDVLVGAPFQDLTAIDEGVGYLFLGGMDALSIAAILPNPTARQGLFGFDAHGGDVNGDGFSDVLVGAPVDDDPQNNEGSVHLFSGSRNLALMGVQSLDNPANQESGEFGTVVAVVGSTTGSDFADLVVGAPPQDNPELDEGNFFFFAGGATGLPSSPTVPAFDNPIDDPGGFFGGVTAAVGDVNGDGFLDLVIGAPFQSNSENREGNAFAYHGSPTGVALSRTLDNPLDQEGSEFGYAVAQ